MTLERISYRAAEDSVELVGAVARPSGAGPHPVVLVAHTWAGCNDFVKLQARKLADMGYIGFAIDAYGGGEVSSDIPTNAQRMQALLDDRALLRRRLDAALQAARQLAGADTDRVGVMGYCFGGLCALELVRSGAKFNGAVSFHGLLVGAEGLPTQPAQTPVLVLHGDLDGFVPDEQIASFRAEMDAAGADWQMHIYSGARHSFTDPDSDNPELGTGYDANADRRSWQAMNTFFAEVFA
ncbi:MAG: dienelactone hydrolase family protein [Gammaproteobacteria bacterium]